MDNKLKALVKEIKYRMDWNTLQVAKSIGYSREYLTTEMNKGDNPDIIKLLSDKHAAILQNVNKKAKSDSDAENSAEAKKEQDLTMQVLSDLIQNNKVVVNAHSRLVDSHNDITASNKELVMLLKSKSTAGVDSHTQLEIHAVVLALREVVVQLSAKVNNTTVEFQDDFLDKMTKASMENLVQKDKVSDADRQGKD